MVSAMNAREAEPARRPRKPQRSERRGAALLFALAVLALLMPLCLGLSKTITTSALSHHVDQGVRLVDDLLAASEGAIEEWLVHEARSLVLPPNNLYPAALVLADHFESDGVDRELTIIAWDQHGLVPLAIARGASPLRLALPRGVASAIDHGPSGGEHPGLDWYLENGDGEAFPPMPRIESSTGEAVLRWPQSTGSSVGAWIATHGSAAINVSTAPIAIVDAALRELGRGGIDLIVAAREKGESVPVPALDGSHRRDERPGFDLVSSSDCFAFRIEARAGRAKRSIWAIYDMHEGKWRLAQRLLIQGE